MRRARHVLPVLLAAGLAGLAAAPVAWAGQIVWSARGAIWAMNDDGSAQHRLVGARDTRLAGILPQGALSSPDVFAGGGMSVLFLGSTNAFSPIASPAACGQDCTDSFALTAGGIVELGPAAGPSAGGAYYESQPRLTADSRELFGSSLWSGLGGGGAGSARSEVAVRAIPGSHRRGTAWSSTAQALPPASGFDAAADPADATQAAWVEQQGCGNYTLNGMPACQFAVRVGPRAPAASLVSIYDDEYEGATGAAAGPSSLDWSADGSTLLMVDPFPPNDGIYEFTAATAATPGKPVTEMLAQPSGWAFDQARFAGSMIVFDAHRGSGATETGDIFTIPASCTATTCSFPASATNLTNDPPANASDPSWTSATTPLAPFDGTVVADAGAAARVTAARLTAASVGVGHPVELTVALNADATILVTVAPRRAGATAKAVGSISFEGLAGTNRLRIGRVAGMRLTAGRYVATVRLQGSDARPLSLSFAVVGT